MCRFSPAIKGAAVNPYFAKSFAFLFSFVFKIAEHELGGFVSLFSAFSRQPEGIIRFGQTYGFVRIALTLAVANNIYFNFRN
jgi:hypothetical protein